MRFLLLFIFLTASATFAQKGKAVSQKEKITDFQGVKRNSLVLNVGGVTGIAGFTYERLLSSQWGIEIGAGYVGAGLGASWYGMPIINGKPRLHLSLRSFYYKIPWTSEELFRHCFSIGLTHFAENGLTFAADIGPCFAHNASSLRYFDPSPDVFRVYITWTLKMGYRF